MPFASDDSSLESRMEEIVRREEVHASQADGSNFEPSQHSSPEALSERLQIDQQRLLYSLAHAEISPRTCDGRGYVRIIGAFADDEDLLHHCDTVRQFDPLASMLLSDMQSWIFVARTIERAANDALRDKIVAEALQMHAENVQRATDEFVAHKKVLLDAHTDDAEVREFEDVDSSDGEDHDGNEGDVVSTPTRFLRERPKWRAKTPSVGTRVRPTLCSAVGARAIARLVGGRRGSTRGRVHGARARMLRHLRTSGCVDTQF